jgi:hypothetical protein
MPSLVMFPFIQCHQTRGRALSGGFSNPLLSGSAPLCAGAGFEARERQSKEQRIAECRIEAGRIVLDIESLRQLLFG